MKTDLICESSDPSIAKIRALYSNPATPLPTLEEDAEEWGITPKALKKKLDEQSKTKETK